MLCVNGCWQLFVSIPVNRWNVLKKSGLDANQPQNYKPVSNVSFLSKLLEKVVQTRFQSFQQHNPRTVSSTVLRRPWRKCTTTCYWLLLVDCNMFAGLDSCVRYRWPWSTYASSRATVRSTRYRTPVVSIVSVWPILSSHLRRRYVINGLHHMLGTTWPASLHLVHGISCRCSWETRSKLTRVR